MLELLFWMSVLALAYGYAGFALLIVLVAKLRPRVVRRAPVTPAMSLIIAAYNEEDGIANRLENALAADYPPDALEILVASDGSSDRTGTIVDAYAPRGVRLLRLPRQGKIPALNEAVHVAAGEILVFSDANIQFHPQALRSLASNFADPAVGGVAGNCSYRLPPGSESSAQGEGLYWRYDTWLKEMESRTGSVVSAHGGLYAIRRELYEPPAESAVTDDFAISTGVIERGYRLVFDREARAFEFAIANADREFQRKVRLITRAWRSVLARRVLLNPLRYGFYSVVLLSHKVLRRLLPLALLVLSATSVLLAPRGGAYLLCAVGQLLFYGAAAAGGIARKARIGGRALLYVPFYYCLANAAGLVALGRFVRGERVSLWQPQRHAAPARGA